MSDTTIEEMKLLSFDIEEMNMIAESDKRPAGQHLGYRVIEARP